MQRVRNTSLVTQLEESVIIIVIFRWTWGSIANRQSPQDSDTQGEAQPLIIPFDTAQGSVSIAFAPTQNSNERQISEVENQLTLTVPERHRSSFGRE